MFFSKERGYYYIDQLIHSRLIDPDFEEQLKEAINISFLPKKGQLEPKIVYCDLGGCQHVFIYDINGEPHDVFSIQEAEEKLASMLKEGVITEDQYSRLTAEVLETDLPVDLEENPGKLGKVIVLDISQFGLLLSKIIFGCGDPNLN
ncbi:MAG TPA: hypothetical protein VGA49_03175 [Patescibacteria group bacterium]